MRPETGATTAHSIKYRPDIDGLRALAILPVIFYHAKLGCPGGFVGVDVFFVISGFLITSLILQEIADGIFTLIGFWERRVRRILPALSLVVLATLIAACFLFLPADFALVGKSAAATAAFGANFFFWKQTGYFAPGSETKPLLHAWSLAVEEQFYLFFPLFLLLLARFRKNAILQGIVTLAVISFALSVAGTYSANNLKSTFFLLPTRAWELMLGALLAALPGWLVAGRPVREIAGWLGLALIAWPVFHYSTATRFPGLAALPPCLGTALLIFSSETKLSSAGRFIAFKPIAFVGLISYSLYLWHWPLLTFAAYLSKYPPTNSVQYKLLAASFVLAVLSWQFVEKPFRQRRIFKSRPQIFAFAGGALATLLALGLLVGAQQGFPTRFPPNVMAYADARFHTPYPDFIHTPKPWNDHLVKFSTTQTNPPVDLVIWGDSHAMALTPMLDQFCRQKSWRAMEATRPGTAPVAGIVGIKEAVEKPSEFGAAVLKYVTETRPRVAVLAAKWGGYNISESFKSNLVVTVQTMLDRDVRVYVVKDVPDHQYNVPHFAALALMNEGNADRLGVTPEQYRQINHELETTFDQMARLGATVLDPVPYFLNRKGLYGVEKGGKVLYFDGNHLSVEGSMMLAPLFEPVFHAE